MSTFDLKKFLINEGLTRVSRDRKRLLKEGSFYGLGESEVLKSILDYLKNGDWEDSVFVQWTPQGLLKWWDSDGDLDMSENTPFSEVYGFPQQVWISTKSSPAENFMKQTPGEREYSFQTGTMYGTEVYNIKDLSTKLSQGTYMIFDESLHEDIFRDIVEDLFGTLEDEDDVDNAYELVENTLDSLFAGTMMVKGPTHAERYFIYSI